MAKNKYGFLFSINFFRDDKVQALIQREGAESFGLMMLLCIRLKKCFNCIGTESDLMLIMRQAHMQKNSIIRWMNKHSDMFVFDDVHRMFAYKGFRKMFGLPDKVMTTELEIVNLYGNHINRVPDEFINDFEEEKSCRKHISTKLYGKKSECFEKENRNFSQTFQKSNAYHADKESVNPSPTIIDDNRKNNNFNITQSKSNIKNKTTPLISFVDGKEGTEGEVFKFLDEKLFSCKEWRNSVTQMRGINLNDDDVMHVFMRWLYMYFQANQTLPESETELRHYANCLLAQGHETRKNFDNFLASGMPQQSSAPQSQHGCRVPKPNTSYEIINGGKRYGLGYLELPDDAPLQTDINERWSYIQHKYIDYRLWDEKAEKTRFRELKLKEKADEEARYAALREECDKRLRREEARQRRDKSRRSRKTESIGNVIKDRIKPLQSWGYVR